jgi:hypothetical protein
LPQYGTGIPAVAVAWIHIIMIHFFTHVFSTTRRLARIHAMLEPFSHLCPACGGDVLESIEHILHECPRWECHRRMFWTLALEFDGFVRKFATSLEDVSAFAFRRRPPLSSWRHSFYMKREAFPIRRLSQTHDNMRDEMKFR